MQLSFLEKLGKLLKEAKVAGQAWDNGARKGAKKSTQGQAKDK